MENVDEHLPPQASRLAPTLQTGKNAHRNLDDWPVWVDPADQPRRSTCADASRAFFRDGKL